MLEVFVSVGIICGAVCATLAHGKDRDEMGYFLLGLVLGVIGVVITALLPSVPGWRADPWGEAVYRYHDGRQWTGYVSDGAGSVQV